MEDKCLELLRSSVDEHKFAGLLLVTKLLPQHLQQKPQPLDEEQGLENASTSTSESEAEETKAEGDGKSDEVDDASNNDALLSNVFAALGTEFLERLLSRPQSGVLLLLHSVVSCAFV